MDESVQKNDLSIAQVAATISGSFSVLGALWFLLAFASTSCTQWRSADISSPMSEKIVALVGGYLLQLAWLSVADIFTGIGYAVSIFVSHDSERNPICLCQSVLLAYFPLSSTLWTGILAFELHRFILYTHRDLKGRFNRSRYLWYHVVGWLFPMIAVIVLYNTNEPDQTGVWCWFGGQHGINAPFYVLYIPKVVTLAFILIIYIRIGIFLKRAAEHIPNCSTQRVRNLVLALFLYPLIFIAVMILPLLNRANIVGQTTAVNSGSIFPSVSVAVSTAVLAAGQGWLNAIVFALTNSSVRRQFNSCCCASRAVSDSSDGSPKSNVSQEESDSFPNSPEEKMNVSPYFLQNKERAKFLVEVASTMDNIRDRSEFYESNLTRRRARPRFISMDGFQTLASAPLLPRSNHSQIGRSLSARSTLQVVHQTTRIDPHIQLTTLSNSSTFLQEEAEVPDVGSSELWPYINYNSARSQPRQSVASGSSLFEALS